MEKPARRDIRPGQRENRKSLEIPNFDQLGRDHLPRPAQPWDQAPWGKAIDSV
jgi:hypothetical protein